VAGSGMANVVANYYYKLVPDTESDPETPGLAEGAEDGETEDGETPVVHGLAEAVPS